MSDVLTPAQRSFCMSRNRGTDTKPEVLLRKALWRLGLRYRLNSRLPGKPDLVFPGSRSVVFVDGCFWHGCPEHFQAPQANASFWHEKLARTRSRDIQVNDALPADGWTVLRVWEHEVRGDVASCAAALKISLLQRSLRGIRTGTSGPP